MGVFIPATPNPNRILITDISLYQGNVDFLKMQERGVGGVVVRVGQKNYLDGKFLENWRRARDANIPRASYWFYDSREKPSVQMKIWIDSLNGDFGDFGLWLDFEEEYGGQYHGWRHWYDCLEILKKLVPPNIRIGIYSNYFYWAEHMTMATFQQKNYFKKYDFWIAGYGTEHPRIPSPFDGYKIHQFTDSLDGYIYGVDGSTGLDGNYFYGNSNDWMAYCQNCLPAPSLTTRIDEITLSLNNGGKKIFIKK